MHDDPVRRPRRSFYEMAAHRFLTDTIRYWYATVISDLSTGAEHDFRSKNREVIAQVTGTIGDTVQSEEFFPFLNLFR